MGIHRPLFFGTVVFSTVAFGLAASALGGASPNSCSEITLRCVDSGLMANADNCDSEGAVACSNFSTCTMTLDRAMCEQLKLNPGKGIDPSSIRAQAQCSSLTEEALATGNAGFLDWSLDRCATVRHELVHLTNFDALNIAHAEALAETEEVACLDEAFSKYCGHPQSSALRATQCQKAFNLVAQRRCNLLVDSCMAEFLKGRRSFFDSSTPEVKECYRACAGRSGMIALLPPYQNTVTGESGETIFKNSPFAKQSFKSGHSETYYEKTSQDPYGLSCKLDDPSVCEKKLTEGLDRLGCVYKNLGCKPEPEAGGKHSVPCRATLLTTQCQYPIKDECPWPLVPRSMSEFVNDQGRSYFYNDVICLRPEALAKARTQIRREQRSPASKHP